DPVTIQTLLSNMKAVGSGGLLRHIPAVDQEGYKSHIHALSRDQRHQPTGKFYWIFKNMDFERWRSAKNLETLWLSGPAESHISGASSRIVDLVKEKPTGTQAQHLVLYFFCSTVLAEASIASTFVSTITSQLIFHLPQLKEKVTMAFLRT